MTSATETPTLPVLDEHGRRALFTDARTAYAFADEPVPDETLHSIWQLAKWPPTAANTQPLRVTYVRTEAGRQRLLPLLAELNRAKTASAPVTAILAADRDFHEFQPIFFPSRPELKDQLAAAGEDGRADLAKFNAALQAGYFLLAARAHGLATGPMGGFDADAVSAEFFPGGRHHAVLVVNLGLPGADAYFPRLPRLADDEVLDWA